MRTNTIAIAAIATILVLAVTPAGAITFGDPDGNGHPNVGLLLGDFLGDGTPVPHCSGTLISETVFLTAGHCTLAFTELSITNIWVTFDSEFHPGTSLLIPASGYATHPDFDPKTLSNDVGVVILSEPVQGVVLGTLPTEDLLGDMKAAGTLQDQTFVNVGYGATAIFKRMPPLLTFDFVRRVSTSPEGALTSNWLRLQANNDATGQGGTCSGDSGGPHFLAESSVIVSVTSWGDGVCRSLNMTQRVDIPSVRAFLDDFVTLP